MHTFESDLDEEQSFPDLLVYSWKCDNGGIKLLIIYTHIVNLNTQCITD